LRWLVYLGSSLALRTSAGTNTFPPALATDVFAGMMTGPSLAEQALALGWVDQLTLAGYAAALWAWGQRPDALWATIMVEIVGRAE